MKKILAQLAKGEITQKEAEDALRLLAIEEIENMAQLDISRELRKGIPEIVYGQSKTVAMILAIIRRVLLQNSVIIISRVKKPDALEIMNEIGSEFKVISSKHSNTLVIKRNDHIPNKNTGVVGIISAGTSDIPIADEARIVAETMGCSVFTTFDVGVAGIHRLFPALKKMIEQEVDVLVVVAGMEGALPSVITGLVDLPVIGVPTSTGYGYGGKGIGALTTMLQSCALGLTVVNIDNGIAAGATAALIAKRVKK